MKIQLFFSILLVTTLFGFKTSDEVELDAYLNARTSPVFYKYTKNVKTTLNPGTKGKVVEVTKTFPTGNQGIKIQISSGPRAGQSYWVYYNKKKPALKLLGESKKEVTTPDKAKSAEVIEKVTATRDMDEHALVEAVKEVSNTTSTQVTTEMTQQEIPCPAISLPEEVVKTAEVEAEVTAVELKASEVEVKAPEVEVKVAEVEVKAPEVEVKAAEVEVKAPEVVRVTTSENERPMEPFERVEPRQEGGCTRRATGDGYTIVKIIECNTSAIIYDGGFEFSNGPGHPFLTDVSSAYEDAGKPRRGIEFISRDKALNDTFVYLTDLAGGPDSHDVKSVMLIIPRKGVPTTEVVGDDVVVTLTTGEKVVFDKKSNAIKSGVMKEGPIDLTTDRFKRTPPNVHYSGAGISIRVDHRFEYPTHGAATAEVRQGTRVCKVPKGKIWDKDGNPLTSDDKSLLNVINSSCPGKGFSL